MKHLKPYNESKNYYNVSKQDIIDICYDITDYAGFDVDFRRSKNRHFILITKPSSRLNAHVFLLKDVVEVLLRLIDYLGDAIGDIVVRGTTDYRWEYFYARRWTEKYFNNVKNMMWDEKINGVGIHLMEGASFK